MAPLPARHEPPLAPRQLNCGANDHGGHGRSSLAWRMDKAYEALAVLADPIRWAVVQHLSDPANRRDAPCGCGVRASDLQAVLGVSQPTVSHHMRRLVESGVVREMRRSRCVFYELDPAALVALRTEIDELEHGARAVITCSR